MLSILLAAALLQAAPASASDVVKEGQGLQVGAMPKTDYELVAWCHGALAGQLELDPIAKADMEKIEGKAKVAARAKEDAEMSLERHQYLKDYEHALSAAEAASPTAIHLKGVAAEQQGYRLWTATRNKEPIWRMLDWGMWDPNDAGCGDAAKRLYNKSTLFGAALKGSDDAAAPATVVAEEAKPVEAAKTEDPVAAPLASAPPPAGESTEAAAKAADQPAAPPPVKKGKAPSKKIVAKAKAPAETAAPAPEPATEPARTEAAPAAGDPAEPAVKAVDQPAAPAPVKKGKSVKKPAAAPTAAKGKLSMDSSAEDIRAAIAAGKAETAAQPAPAADKPAATSPDLRGPQQ